MQGQYIKAYLNIKKNKKRDFMDNFILLCMNKHIRIDETISYLIAKNCIQDVSKIGRQTPCNAFHS